MIIDAKGRLFGKISIIDVLIGVCIAGMIIGVSLRFFTSGGLSKAQTSVPIELTLCAREVRQFTISSVDKGDVVFDDSGARLGAVIAVSTTPAKRLFETENGKIYNAEVPNKYDLYIKIDATGQADKSGYFINGNRQMSSGSSQIIHTNHATMECIVWSVAKRVD